MIRGDTSARALFSRASSLVASRSIAADTDLESVLKDPPPDVDAEVLRQLGYMYDAGAWVLLESAIADLPTDLRWLFESGAVTIEQLAALHQALGVTSAADLAADLRRGAIGSVPGLDASTAAAIQAALPTLRSGVARIPLGRALAIADPVVAALQAVPGIAWIAPVGSLRRGEELVGDIEFMAPADDPQPAIDALVSLPDVGSILHRGSRRVCLLIDRVQVGVRFPDPAVAGAVLLQLTGSTAHLDQLQERAASRGRTLDAEGLSADANGATAARSEESIYQALDLQWIPPEIRDGDIEVERAAVGSLPALLSRENIRGDLHMHTQWSDGRDTVAAMVEASVALGYEYVAITDHSARAAASRTLSADGVKKQAEEIAEARERFPAITILHGCEVDILAGGRLDFSDRVLGHFDIVLASLHERLGDGPDVLLRRYLAAMQHPMVSIITHPTNRILPVRPGYELDWDVFFAAAVETRTIVEIDGAPAHLDMNGALARRAIAAGVTVSVDSDCHRADMLWRQMALGVTMARRGWVEARHVVNTRSVEAVRTAIGAKRGR